MPVQPHLRVKILLKFKYENIVWLAFQKNLYSKTRLDGHITICEKSVFFWSWILKNHIQVQKRKTILYASFTSSMKLEMRHFHISGAGRAKKCTVKVCCSCRALVLPSQPIAFVMFLLLLLLWHLKLHILLWLIVEKLMVQVSQLKQM